MRGIWDFAKWKKPVIKNQVLCDYIYEMSGIGKSIDSRLMYAWGQGREEWWVTASG